MRYIQILVKLMDVGNELGYERGHAERTDEALFEAGMALYLPGCSSRFVWYSGGQD